METLRTKITISESFFYFFVRITTFASDSLPVTKHCQREVVQYPLLVLPDFYSVHLL